MTATMPIRVLFVCTHNSARSQLAEALLGRFGGERFVVRSAGTEPSQVNPYAVRVLAELGTDWSAAESSPLERYVDEPWDYVITVCDDAREACPIFTGAAASLHWGLEDPAAVVGTDEERLAAFRATAEQLAARIGPFVAAALRAAGDRVGPGDPPRGRP